MGEVDLLFLLDRVREGEMIGLYTVKFLFFKLYIYDILHVQICLLKIMGIHLNTLELHWARLHRCIVTTGFCILYKVYRRLVSMRGFDEKNWLVWFGRVVIMHLVTGEFGWCE